MSLDRRLRSELEREGEQIVADVDRNLVAVQSRVRGDSRSSLLPLVLATLGLAVVIGVRFGAIGPVDLFGQGPPSVEPSAASPSPAGTCVAGQGRCLGVLAPGTYRGGDFRPTVEFTVPEGWAKTQDVLWQLDLQSVGGGQYSYPDNTTFHDGISLFLGPVPAASATHDAVLGVGLTAHDLATWLSKHADLVATGLTPVSIGGVSGYRINLSLPVGPRSAPDHCTADHGEPRCESLFVGDFSGGRYGFGLVGPESAVVYLLDAPGDVTVMVVIDDVDGVDPAGLRAAATPVVESLRFPSDGGSSPSP